MGLHVWLFPAGIPHSIQGLNHGCKFLLVFDDGNFSENETFLLSDFLAHTPRAALAKNFGVSESEFADIPSEVLWIFSGDVPYSLFGDQVRGPQGVLPAERFVHRLGRQQPIDTLVGTVRIVDSTNFPVATTIAAALVEVDPGDSPGKARTFDFSAGDVGYVPFATGHYVENTGETVLRFLEVFKGDRFADISLNQWRRLMDGDHWDQRVALLVGAA